MSTEQPDANMPQSNSCDGSCVDTEALAAAVLDSANDCKNDWFVPWILEGLWTPLLLKQLLVHKPLTEFSPELISSIGASKTSEASLLLQQLFSIGTLEQKLAIAEAGVLEIKQVRELLTDPHRELRGWAVSAIAQRSPAERASVILQKLITDTSTLVLMATESAAKQHLSQSERDQMVKLLPPNLPPENRFYMVLMLHGSDDPHAQQFLYSQICASDEPFLDEQAADSLAAAKKLDPAVRKRLLKLLVSSDEASIETAARALYPFLTWEEVTSLSLDAPFCVAYFRGKLDPDVEEAIKEYSHANEDELGNFLRGATKQTPPSRQVLELALTILDDPTNPEDLRLDAAWLVSKSIPDHPSLIRAFLESDVLADALQTPAGQYFDLPVVREALLSLDPQVRYRAHLIAEPTDEILDIMQQSLALFGNAGTEYFVLERRLNREPACERAADLLMEYEAFRVLQKAASPKIRHLLLQLALNKNAPQCEVAMLACHSHLTAQTVGGFVEIFRTAEPKLKSAAASLILAQPELVPAGFVTELTCAFRRDEAMDYNIAVGVRNYLTYQATRQCSNHDE